ncbi:hypothetical protein PROFUN_17083, partial [Planoprotostelium fungivorum]
SLWGSTGLSGSSLHPRMKTLFDALFPSVDGIWTTSKISRGENSKFKKHFIKQYGVQYTKNRKKFVDVECQMTQQLLNSRGNHSPCVKASHLVPYWCAALMTVFGVRTDDINNARNSLLLCSAIEEAFDQLQLCFIVTLQGNFQSVVLNPALPSKKTFSSIDRQNLHLPSGLQPYRQVLSVHAHKAHHEAFGLGWIDQNQLNTFIDYHTLSQDPTPGADNNWPSQPGLPDRKDMETRDERFERGVYLGYSTPALASDYVARVRDDTDWDEKVQDEAVRGDEENPLWQSALMRFSWRKPRKREFVVSRKGNIHFQANTQANTQANNNNMPKKGRRTTTTTTPSEPDNDCGWGYNAEGKPITIDEWNQGND